MPDLALHVADLSAGVALVPAPIELLGCPSELHDEITGEVLRLGLPPLLAPQADQGGFIGAHDDAGIRSADEMPDAECAKAVLDVVLLRADGLSNNAEQQANILKSVIDCRHAAKPQFIKAIECASNTWAAGNGAAQTRAAQTRAAQTRAPLTLGPLTARPLKAVY